MNKYLLVLFFLFFKQYVLFAQQSTTNVRDTIMSFSESEKIKSLVQKYSALVITRGNIDSITNLSSVPFAWENGKIIRSIRQLKKELTIAFADKKGRLILKSDTILIKEVKIEIHDKGLPVLVSYVEQTFKYIGGEDNKEQVLKVIFAVQLTNPPKVIGVTGRKK